MRERSGLLPFPNEAREDTRIKQPRKREVLEGNPRNFFPSISGHATELSPAQNMQACLASQL